MSRRGIRSRCLYIGRRSSSISFHGDSTRPQVYKEILEAGKGVKFDSLITDPPYCLLTRRRANGDLRDPKIASRERKLLDSDVVKRFENMASYYDFTRAWINAVVPLLHKEAPLVIWTNPLGKHAIIGAASECGYQLLGEYLWMKTSALRKSAASSTKNETLYLMRELAVVLRREPMKVSSPHDPSLPWCVASPNDRQGESGVDGDHPCAKPLAVLEPLIRTWSKPGDFIIDPFHGSGAILKIAQQLQRSSVGIEINQKWSNAVQQHFARSPRTL